MARADRAFGVVTIRRCLADYDGQQIGSRFEDIGSFKSDAGCPANIAIGTARLGLKSALPSSADRKRTSGLIREQKREGVTSTDWERMSLEQAGGARLGYSPEAGTD